MLSKSKSGMIHNWARIFITIILAAVLFMVLSFKPLYSNPIINDKNMNLFSDIKSEKAIDINTSRYNILAAETANKKVQGGISKNQNRINPGKEVRGFVVNKYGKYIEGTTVNTQVSKTGVSTDAIGHFILSNISENDSLIFSHEGYLTQTLKPVFSSEMVVRCIIAQEFTLPKERIINTFLPKPGTNPLIVIDSVAEEKITMADIDPNNGVSSIILLRGKDATDKYGEKGRNGVIEILTIERPKKTEEKSISGTQISNKLTIVNGVIYTKNPDDIPVVSIQKVSLLSKNDATNKYGKRGKNGAIEITTKGNESSPFDIKPSDPQKAEQQVNMNGVVAVTNMNVLYIGISNPVEIAVPGVTPEKVTAAVTNGTISRTATGWEVRPSSFSDLVLTVLVDNKKANEKIFRVKPIPVPVAVFAGKSVGSESRNKILQARTLEAELKDFLWDLKFEVVRFTFLYRKDGIDKEITTEGNRLTDEMNLAISELARGKYITFKDIRALGPDGKIHDLSPLILKIE